MRSGLLVLALALAACGQGAPTGGASIAPEASREFVLACNDFAALTPDSLAQRFGAENITTQTFETEGEPYQATVVFNDDPLRRLVITWNEARTELTSVTVQNEGTRWRAAEGYTIGTPIGDVERINVMPFKLWGFGWDYGGRVSDWSAGVLAQNPICRTSLAFTPREDGNTNAVGDSEFSSNDPAVRAADPVVSDFGLMVDAPNRG